MITLDNLEGLWPNDLRFIEQSDKSAHGAQAKCTIHIAPRARPSPTKDKELPPDNGSIQEWNQNFVFGRGEADYSIDIIIIVIDKYIEYKIINFDKSSYF